jgi:hypothetical protein
MQVNLEARLRGVTRPVKPFGTQKTRLRRLGFLVGCLRTSLLRESGLKGLTYNCCDARRIKWNG